MPCNRAQRVLEMKRKEVEEQTSKILTGQNELGELRRKVQSTQAQILQLLESKKAAVTGYDIAKPCLLCHTVWLCIIGRQFKEASRLANESKSIGLVLEENKARLSDAEETMITSSKKLAELSDEHSKLRGELAKLEKNEGCGYYKLLLTIKLLIIFKQMKITFRICCRLVVLSVVYWKWWVIST